MPNDTLEGLVAMEAYQGSPKNRVTLAVTGCLDRGLTGSDGDKVTPASRVEWGLGGGSAKQIMFWPGCHRVLTEVTNYLRVKLNFLRRHARLGIETMLGQVIVFLI